MHTHTYTNNTKKGDNQARGFLHIEIWHSPPNLNYVQNNTLILNSPAVSTLWAWIDQSRSAVVFLPSGRFAWPRQSVPTWLWCWPPHKPYAAAFPGLSGKSWPWSLSAEGCWNSSPVESHQCRDHLQEPFVGQSRPRWHITFPDRNMSWWVPHGQSLRTAYRPVPDRIYS